MSEPSDKFNVESCVLFDRSAVDNINDILREKHSLLFFENNWQPRRYMGNESSKYMFTTALFNAYFLFHEAVPMTTVYFNKFWKDKESIVCNVESICKLRNIFAHNYINSHRHFICLQSFVSDIDNELPKKLRNKRSCNSNEHYLFLLPTENDFWDKALVKICEMSDKIIEKCLNEINDRTDITKEYIQYYKLYILKYFENNYKRKNNSFKDEIENCMNNKFLESWDKDDIYPETICEKFIVK